MSIANAVILCNLCKKNDEREMKTREICKEVSRKYLSRSQLGNFKSHRHTSQEQEHRVIIKDAVKELQNVVLIAINITVYSVFRNCTLDKH